MTGAKQYLQAKLLKTLDPLSSLALDKLDEIANKSIVEELPPGRTIFRQGEKDKRCIYLLQGSLELQVTGNPRSETIKAKSNDARYPIAQQWPRPSTCRTKTNCVILYIDSDLLEILLNDDPSGHYEVTEIGGDADAENDWMLRFLQSPAFLQLPTDNIQSLLVKLEEIPAAKGKTIVQQGESDQWYYIVKTGKCTVSRRPAPKAAEVRLALLGPGDGFGEEALITDGRRNATITMKESGVLMRLGKEDFNNLLVKPLLSYVNHDQMTQQVKTGAALIDVRNNKEFSTDGLKTALNIPLSMLRVKARDLNATRPHIVYCQDGNQSSAAAFLLAQQGIEVHILKGGLNAQDKPFSTAVTAQTTVDTEPMLAAAATNTTDTNIPTLESSQAPATQSKLKQRLETTEQAPSTISKPAQNKEFNALGNSTSSPKPDSLRDRSDALKLQAERLAQKTAGSEAEKQRLADEANQARLEIEKERNTILAKTKADIEAEQQRAQKEAEETRRLAEEQLSKIKQASDSMARQQTEIQQGYQRTEEEHRSVAAKLELKKLKVKEQEEQARKKADEIRQKALQEAEAIRRSMEERKARHEAEERQRIEAELDTQRKSQISMQEAAKAAEAARQQAHLEAEAIKREAAVEAEKLREQLAQEKQRASELNARKQAEEELHYQETVEKAKQQALQKAKEEAELIRQQAEATRTKAELDAKALRRHAMEEARNKALAEAQQQAQSLKQKTLDEAMSQVQIETDELRKRAIQEAMQSTQEVRLKAAQEAEIIRKEAFEQARNAGIDAARSEAEKEANIIREQAMQEAESLRSQMEETRTLVESHAKRAQIQINEDNARNTAQQEAESLAQAAAQAAQREAEQATQREAEQATQREAEQARVRHNEEVRQKHAQEQHKARLRAAELREQAEREAATTEYQQQAEIEATKRENESVQQARVMAESIRNKLNETSVQRQQDEHAEISQSGPKLANARLHVINDKTILEGDEDIFVFKAPSERPPSREEAEALIANVESQMQEKVTKALPNFDIEFAEDDKAGEYDAGTDSEFSDSIMLDLDQITAQSSSATSIEAHKSQKEVKAKQRKSKIDDDFEFPEFDNGRAIGRNKKRSFIALAASVVVMLTVSIAAITQPSYVEVAEVDEVYSNESTGNNTSLASMRAHQMNGGYQQEEALRQVKANAEKEFQKKLNNVQ